MTPDPTGGTVLFVCEHGTAKSVLAKLLFEEYAAQCGLGMRAESRGSAADPELPGWMPPKLATVGLRLGDFRPRPLAAQDLDGARVVVSFDQGPALEAGPRTPHHRWDALPAASEQFEASHAAIRARVHELVDSLRRAAGGGVDAEAVPPHL